MRDDRADAGRYAILTFHRAINCGAVLQCYALQEAIIGMGCSCEVLDYTPQIVFDRGRKPQANLKACVGWGLTAGKRRRKVERFDAFASQFLNLTEPVVLNDFKSVVNLYDGIVAGSDQVWNMRITGNDENFFLGPVSDCRRKRSYAASIGTSAFLPEQESRLAQLLGEFSNVCVREKTAAEYLKELLGRDVATACDPVLLQPAEVWHALAVDPLMAKPYVLIYALSGVTQNSYECARLLAKERNAQLVVIQSGYRPVYGAHVIYDAGPREFLGLVANAEAVVTESFHGSCFSILFERDLYWCPADSFAGWQSRVVDLLDAVGLRGCRVIEGHRDTVTIDWSDVRSRIDLLRGDSYSVLRRETLGLIDE